MDGDRRAGTGGRGPDDRELSRRDLIKLTVAAAIAAPLVDVSDAMAQAARGAARRASASRFFTKDELALVDALTEIIIPADDHSPGARAAKVAAFVDGQLAETLDAERQASWRAGLKAIDARSEQLYAKPFLRAAPAEQEALLTEMAKNEFDPKTPEEKFFRELKVTTAYAYYTTDIGIHKEIGYLGNTYQTGEYAGYDVSVEDAAPAGTPAAAKGE